MSYKKGANILTAAMALMGGDILDVLPEKYRTKYTCKYSKCGKQFIAESQNKTTCCCKEHFFLYLEEKKAEKKAEN